MGLMQESSRWLLGRLVAASSISQGSTRVTEAAAAAAAVVETASHLCARFAGQSSSPVRLQVELLVREIAKKERIAGPLWMKQQQQHPPAN